MAEPKPEYVDRRALAAEITEKLFAVTHRALETWPLTLVQVGRRKLVRREEGLAVARERLKTAPRRKSGR